jgi:UDP-glucuronate 4-epimerase
MRYLVTGVAGFIGSHLCERLLADGHKVLGMDSLTDYYERSRKVDNLRLALESSRFEFLQADLLATDLREALSSVDGVFHLAGQPGVRSSWADFDDYLRLNVAATKHLMDAVSIRRIPVVYASSSSVYGEAIRMPIREDDPTHPVSPYGVTKLAGEHIVSLFGRADDVPVASLRYFTVYGPRQRPDMAFSRFIDAAASGRPILLLGDGEQSRDFTFVADAVDATVRAMGATPGRYNVGGGSRATVNQVIEMLTGMVGRKPKIRQSPKARGDAMHTWADTTRARAALGWEPRTSLSEGLARQFEWATAAVRS